MLSASLRLVASYARFATYAFVQALLFERGCAYNDLFCVLGAEVL